MTVTALAFALAVVLATVQTAPSAENLAEKVQQRYDKVRDFEADFVQTYEGGVLKTKSSERGTVAIKRPGRMRWVYSQPERKEFVSDGSRIYSYLPADKQVIVSPVPTGDTTTPAMFLTGRGNLVRDFTATLEGGPGDSPDLVGLKLVPRRGDPEYEWLLLGVDPTTFQIRVLAAADRQGGRSTFTFSNLRENRGLSDKMFEFRIPRGVDVISNGVPSK